MNTDTIEQSTALELAAPRDTAVMPGFNSQSSWELANRIGKAFAASSIVPETYRGNVANCIVALEMANRMGASPLMVMQNLYLVHGNPGWSSKFLIACFNQSGRYTAMRYRWNEARTACRAWAVEKSTGEELVGPEVTTGMAKEEGWSTKAGSKWKTMPELMLMYRAAAFMIRTYAPEISMGLRSEDEIIDTIDEVKPSSGIAAVRAALAGADPATGEVAPPPSKPVKIDDAKTLQQFIDDVNNATDAETATLALDAAQDVLDATDMAELDKAYKMAWSL
jgi:hypothetical protein